MTLQEILNKDFSIPQKQILCGKFKLPVKAVARLCNLSMSHCCNVLNGSARLTPNVEARLNRLIEQLETEGGDSER